MENEHKHLKIHTASGTMGHSIKDFFPLLGILVLVGILSAIGIIFLQQSAMLAFMGYFFFVFGTLKLLKIHGFVEAYRMYDVIAKRSKGYAYLYPFLEIGFGLAYLFVWQIEVVSAAVVVIMLIGAYGVFLKLREREEIPCACLGTVFKIPMTWVTLAEDLLMAGMALIILL